MVWHHISVCGEMRSNFVKYVFKRHNWRWSNDNYKFDNRWLQHLFCATRNLSHIVMKPSPHCSLHSIIPDLLLYLPHPLSSFTLDLKPFFFSNHSLLSLFATTFVSSLASWPGSLFHLIVISLLSFISTSFIYASVCELASCSHSCLAGFIQAL